MTGYIDANGKYVRGADISLTHDISSQWKSWNHEDQKRRYAGDIVQPYVDGKPNPEFVQIYRGEVANNYFKQEDIDKADRNLGGIQ